MAGERDITFLFTDIVGSTRLWNRARSAMAAAVARHDALLREIVTTNDGTVFKTVGDAVYAVFERPSDAVRAAVEAQRAILAEPWQGFDPGDTIRVRMAIHTGHAEQREGDYFGSTLNRLSRTLDAGYGGQILCTDDTVTACGEHWPDGIALRDLGARTLRDVPGSSQIYQLVTPGLPEHFPPLETLDPRIHNLPRWASTLVGRETEQARIQELARSAEVSLVTVLGAGGVGKTRLTTEALAPLLDEFQDGIRFVDLSALREDAQVIPSMVAVTGAADQLLDPHDALLEWLRPRTLLLVLDNCEQVIGGVASICRDIIAAAPGVTILATSRTPIHIRGERQLSLKPLPLPADETTAADNPAVRLFIERATEVQADFALDPASTIEVAAICRLLDGLPLAIELAAAWVRILSPEALHRRLKESRAMLRDGARDLPDRQRALATTIAWSYDLLDPDDQRAFRRLAVFRGGIAVDAASAVLWDDTERDPLWAFARLDALVQANLLHVTPDPTGEPRFTMLQTIHEFAEHTLRSCGEWESAATAHVEFFAVLAQEAKRHRHTESWVACLDRLDREFENLHSMIESVSMDSSLHPLGLSLIVELAPFLDQRCHYAEARTWFERIYNPDVRYPPEILAEALFHVGNASLSDPALARGFYDHAVDVAEVAGLPALRIRLVATLSSLSFLSGDYDGAATMAREVIAFGKETANPNVEALGFTKLALALSESGRYEAALAASDQALAINEQGRDLDGVAWEYVSLGRTFRRLGRRQPALSAFENALERFEEIGDLEAMGWCHLQRGLAMLNWDRIGARQSIASAVALLATIDDAYSMIELLEGCAQLYSLEEEWDQAVMFWSAAQRLRTQTGIVPAVGARHAFQTLLDRASAIETAPAFERAAERGSALAPRVALEQFA